MVTIYDIAKKTGFSPATVSKALNNYKGVKKETYDAVLKCAKDMGYTVNVNARALVTNKSWLIGVLFSADLDTGIAHPHFSGILESFQKTAGTHGYDIVFVNRDLGMEKMSFLEHCRLRRVDGVLIAANMKYYEDVKSVVESNLKMVSVEAPYDDKYCVISDNELGVKQGMKYLYSLGHRKIANIAAPLNSTAGQERYNAYKMFCEQNGIEITDDMVAEATDYTYECGLEAARELLMKAVGDMPTAISCAYDKFAFAAISVLMEQGFRVPEDISIIGFDDLASAEYVNQGLTTISQNRDEIGKRAAEILIDLIEGNKVPREKHMCVETSLMIRKSTKRNDL